MRIALFTLAYPPFVGGAELAAKEITDRLPQYKFQVFTHDFQRYGSGKLVKFFYIFRAWRAAERAHREKPFDAIWAMMAAYGGLAALLFKLRHPKIPMLLTLQEGDSESHILGRVGIFYPFWRLIFKKADYIQTISNYLADFARRHGSKCPVEVVPNGVNLDAIQKIRIHPNDPKRKTFTIITTSRLVHKNGIDVLIRAAAQLKTLIPNSQFLIQILGSGSDEQKLKNLAKELNVEKEIEFLGHVEPDKIPKYLLSADIFVRASRSEGLGSSFLEAMAAGLPIIGTPVGGIPDFLRDYNLRTSGVLRTPDVQNIDANGLFVKVDDGKDLAEKIASLLQNEKLRKQLGESGRRLVFEKYSWDSIAEKIGRIFDLLKKI